MTYQQALAEEEKNKEKIYGAFESQVRELIKTEHDAQRYQESGSYEDQDSFTAARALYAARNKRHDKEMLVKGLYERPYFAHISVRYLEDNDKVECFLSDNDQLENIYNISGDSMILMPFKQDPERPFFNTIFSCYAKRSGDELKTATVNRATGRTEYEKVRPELIRDVDVFKREIRGIHTFLPKIAEEVPVEADELLAQKLEENRNDVRFRNIIATLQAKQFNIISYDLKKSFVMQGCAGSGKTQCLIHRLFFLRDSFRATEWRNVLLITPSQLFRNYASPLIKRYHLGNIANTSLAYLYKDLLEGFDRRFSDRQYRFELTEEYLPDGYLQNIYRPEEISRIDGEIRKAISDHTKEGCRLTGISMPPEEDIDKVFIEKLSSVLKSKIEHFDEKENAIKEDHEFLEHRAELEKLEKQLVQTEKRVATYIEEADHLQERKSMFRSLEQAYQSAEDDIIVEKIDFEHERSDLLEKLQACVEKIDRGRTYEEFSRSIKEYIDLREKISQRLTGKGEDEEFKRSYMEMLEGISEASYTALIKFTEGVSIEDWPGMIDREIAAVSKKIKHGQDDTARYRALIDQEMTWLQEHDPSALDIQRKAYRSELTNARSHLERIESTIFEKEVWNALAPLKERFGIQTLQIDHLDDKHWKETRILYKSDLLFYMHIYMRLHRTDKLPQYSFICIDEGQDLHSADYKLLKEIYPKAVFNIFGDIQQVVHGSCGVKDWKQDTGIETVFEMNDNYRNKASIVEYCNKKFGCNMDHFGNIMDKDRPVEIRDPSQLRAVLEGQDTTVILKNKESFERFCELINDKETIKRLRYVDTKTESIRDIGTDIPCYSVFAAKGLEFKRVLIFADDMNRNQKIVSCTRAMSELYFYE